jgi:hypothetical protein
MNVMRFLIVVTVVAASSGGCKEAHVHEAFFPSLNESQARHALVAQAARGARVDATLYAMHFDGPSLNSLGQAKLNLMLEGGEGDSAIVVYLGMAEAEIAERRAAVEAYLAGTGLATSQFKTVAGVNPSETHVAADSLSRLKKTESPQGVEEVGQPLQLDVTGMSPGAAAK